MARRACAGWRQVSPGEELLDLLQELLLVLELVLVLVQELLPDATAAASQHGPVLHDCHLNVTTSGSTSTLPSTPLRETPDGEGSPPAHGRTSRRGGGAGRQEEEEEEQGGG